MVERQKVDQMKCCVCEANAERSTNKQTICLLLSFGQQGKCQNLTYRKTKTTLDGMRFELFKLRE